LEDTVEEVKDVDYFCELKEAGEGQKGKTGICQNTQGLHVVLRGLDDVWSRARGCLPYHKLVVVINVKVDGLWDDNQVLPISLL